MLEAAQKLGDELYMTNACGHDSLPGLILYLKWSSSRLTGPGAFPSGSSTDCHLHPGALEALTVEDKEINFSSTLEPPSPSSSQSQPPLLL